MDKATSDRMALEALEAFAHHLTDYTGRPAVEYKDFDFDWSDQSWEGPNVIVEALKRDGGSICEATVFTDSGIEFSRVSYEALENAKARGIIAGYVLALKEGR